MWDGIVLDLGCQYCQIFNQVCQGMGKNRKMTLWGYFLGVLWPAWGLRSRGHSLPDAFNPKEGFFSSHSFQL